jgi:hypothetical protein
MAARSLSYEQHEQEQQGEDEQEQQWYVCVCECLLSTSGKLIVYVRVCVYHRRAREAGNFKLCSCAITAFQKLLVIRRQSLL